MNASLGKSGIVMVAPSVVETGYWRVVNRRGLVTVSASLGKIAVVTVALMMETGDWRVVASLAVNARLGDIVVVTPAFVMKARLAVACASCWDAMVRGAGMTMLSNVRLS